MDSLEQELLQDAEDDARTVEFIKNYLPQEVKDKFTDEELYYFLSSWSIMPIAVFWMRRPTRTAI